jgi:septal ring factor EnvC (AmiA/AmiB activator)
LTSRRQEIHQKLSSRQEEIQGRVKELARRADTLKDLIDRLVAEEEARLAAHRPSKKPDGTPAAKAVPEEPVRTGPAFASLTGKLSLPAQGPVIHTFGDKRSPGGRDKGITIQTRSGAQVVAPYDGKVVFAGSFRGYGLILIIDHGQGYHTLLAGFGSVDAAAGQWLLAGEPVGTMISDTGQKPQLYVELRKKGQPVNPLSWFAQNKVNG